MRHYTRVPSAVHVAPRSAWPVGLRRWARDSYDAVGTVFSRQQVRDVGQRGPTSQIGHRRCGCVPTPDHGVPPRPERLGLVFLCEGHIEPNPARVFVS